MQARQTYIAACSAINDAPDRAVLDASMQYVHRAAATRASGLLLLHFDEESDAPTLRRKSQSVVRDLRRVGLQEANTLHAAILGRLQGALVGK